MAFYYVSGQDAFYNGSHGMKYESIIDGTVDDAIDEGRELSIDVISSYSMIREFLEQEISDECSIYDINYEDIFTWSEDDYDKIEEIREMVYEEDIDFFYIELDEAKLPTKDPYELEDLLHTMGTEEFLNNYELKNGEF